MLCTGKFHCVAGTLLLDISSCCERGGRSIDRGVNMTFFLHSAGIAVGQLVVRQTEGKVDQARGPRAF